MSFYNTGNPVPSIDPRDLDDNAKHVDELVNSTLPTFVDRLGSERRTLAGIEADADAIVLRDELAEPDGASLVGWVREYPLTTEPSVSYVLSLQPISIWEKQFTDLITDKPSINDPQTWDWAPAIQAASNLIRSRFNTYGPGIQNVIDFPGGRYPVKSQVIISAFVKLKSSGMVIFETYVANDSAFRFTPSTGDYSSNSTVIFKQQWFRGPFIDGTAGGFTFHNKLDKFTSSSTAIELGPRSDLGALLPFSRYSACHFNVENYAVGIKFNRFRNYIASFFNVHLELNTILVYFGDPGTVVTDSGENISFVDSIFANAQTGFHWEVDGFDLNLSNCSADYIGTVFRCKQTYKHITMNGGHIEGIGGEIAHDGIGGILLEEATGPADAGITMPVYINGVSMLVNPGHMFRGSSKVRLTLDVEYRKKAGVTVAVADVQLCDNTIVMARRNINMQQKACIPSLSINSSRNPTFSLDADGFNALTASPVGYLKDHSAIASATIDAANGIFGGKSVRLVGGATGSFYGLTSVDKYPIHPGQSVIANVAIKLQSPSTALNTQPGVTIKFFDSADNLLLTTAESLLLLGASDLVLDQWGYPTYARIAVAPSGTAYYTVRYGVAGFGFNNNTVYMSGMYNTILE